MANIKHLEMCENVKNLPQIEIKKTCFGLSTQVIYSPTKSKVKAKQNEYSVENGTRLEKILNADETTAMEMLQKKQLKPSSMGNIRLDACISNDHQFAAVQLLRFIDFNYQPFTDVVVYEGKTAEAIADLFE